MKETDVEFLQYIHQNALMGGENLKVVLNDIKDARLCEVLRGQIKEYQSVAAQADKKLTALGETAEQAPMIAQIYSKIMINMKTMMDKSPEKIAELVIQGSTMGITDITKQLKKFQDCDTDAVNLAYRLKCVEQKNLDEMKHFL